MKKASSLPAIKILVLLLIFVSCKVEDKNNLQVEEFIDPADSSEVLYSTPSVYSDLLKDKDHVENLKTAIYTKGDTLAFHELEEIYFLSENKNDFLYTAMLMANQYQYHGAYYSCYLIFSLRSNNSPEKFNSLYANYNILKAYEIKNKKYKQTINSIFNNQQIPTSKEYWNLIYEAFNKNDLVLPTGSEESSSSNHMNNKDPLLRNFN
jgi:hypothetical protein